MGSNSGQTFMLRRQQNNGSSDQYCQRIKSCSELLYSPILPRIPFLLAITTILPSNQAKHYFINKIRIRFFDDTIVNRISSSPQFAGGCSRSCSRINLLFYNTDSSFCLLNHDPRLCRWSQLFCTSGVCKHSHSGLNISGKGCCYVPMIATGT